MTTDTLLDDGLSNGVVSLPPEKLIIDTDPGIDDSMTILMAFQTPEVEIIGFTTIFGNVMTEDATKNTLLLCEMAGCPDVPVAQGSPEPLKGGEPSVADFVHGSDGLGNLSLPPPKSTKSEKSAAEFLVDKVSEHPGEVSVLALGPLTNIAMAIKRDSSFASKVKRIVVLGGAFFCLGNVNPASDANSIPKRMFANPKTREATAKTIEREICGKREDQLLQDLDISGAGGILAKKKRVATTSKGMIERNKPSFWKVLKYPT